MALPFPSLAAPSQYHDHWIGLCALACGGISIQDEVLQDYIQHGANVVGESRQSLSTSVRNTVRFVKRYEGNASVLSICRIIYKTGLGWRTLMARTLLERVEPDRLGVLTDLGDSLHLYAFPRMVPLLRLIFTGVRSNNVSPVRGLEILLGVVIRRFAG